MSKNNRFDDEETDPREIEIQEVKGGFGIKKEPSESVAADRQLLGTGKVVPAWKMLSRNIIQDPRFSKVIHITLIVYCALLLLSYIIGSGMGSRDTNLFWHSIDLLVTLIFVLEAIIKMAALGIFAESTAYFHDPINQLDFFVVISQILALVYSPLSLLKPIRLAILIEYFE